ncbi:MAG: hypothetical protein QM504_12845 [Pseudomonadota bacterium]
MNFKILLFIFTIIPIGSFASNNILLGGKYTIKLHVQDPEERYPVTIQLLISDNAKINKAKFTYPTYDCIASFKDSLWSKNKVEIYERITHGKDKCEETSYLFHFKHGALYEENGSRINRITNRLGKLIIPSNIKSLTFQPTQLSKFRIKYKVRGWDDISNSTNIQMLHDYVSLDDKAKYSNLAIELIFKLAGNRRKTLKPLIYKYPNTNAAIRAEKFIFDEVKLINSWDSYLTLLDDFPNSNIITSMEVQPYLFNIASKVNNKETYYSFLKKYPSLSNEKLKEIESNLFKIAKTSKNIEEIYSFVDKHPNSEHINSAIYELFKEASRKNSWDSYAKIIKKYPTSEYSGKALKKIYDLVIEKNKIPFYFNFFEQFPHSKLQKDTYSSFIRLAEKENDSLKYTYYISYLNLFPKDEYIPAELAAMDEERLKIKQRQEKFVATKMEIIKQSLIGAKYIGKNIWQDQPVNKKVKWKSYSGAKEYCASLNLLGIYEWELPSFRDFKKAYNEVSKLQYFTTKRRRGALTYGVDYFTRDEGCIQKGLFYIPSNECVYTFSHNSDKYYMQNKREHHSVRCVLKPDVYVKHITKVALREAKKGTFSGYLNAFIATGNKDNIKKAYHLASNLSEKKEIELALIKHFGIDSVFKFSGNLKGNKGAGSSLSELSKSIFRSIESKGNAILDISINQKNNSKVPLTHGAYVINLHIKMTLKYDIVAFGIGTSETKEAEKNIEVILSSKNSYISTTQVDFGEIIQDFRGQLGFKVSQKLKDIKIFIIFESIELYEK